MQRPDMAEMPETTPPTAPGFRPVALGLWVAAAIFVFDQASKLWLIYGTDIRLTYPWPVLPWFDLTVVWNYGISYGLFQQHSDIGRWALTAFKLGAAIFLAFWLRKSTGRLEAAGIGMIIGGALGNALDRALHGAVFDFAHFHIGDFSWYVFNIADAAIVAGVGLMLLSQFFTRPQPPGAASAPEKP
ncbi:MAG: signal peptidase [Beijerinckiaceae bacterium]|nr:MAG: signal peptidase [Beijerinckiaceae bacterium]